ncbi:hypothetical protein ACEZCY_03600 [Streptacidiphilus sp. N1-12]|uniref:Uncharacterized protein n=2 Tax=Streptacidiphilus alkalitolerans TaxID=3342712 RepID=A0ABV6WWC2_9ACTN
MAAPPAAASAPTPSEAAPFAAGAFAAAPGSSRAGRTAQALRDRLGWICCATGVLLCALGWYGVSGERYTARQIPYLASATAPGAALIVGGSVLLAARRRGARPSPEYEQLQRQLATLTRLLTEAVQAEQNDRAEASEIDGSARPWLLAVPGGRTYHRSDCLLVQGRQDPEQLLNGDVASRGLRPCPLCEPPEGT